MVVFVSGLHGWKWWMAEGEGGAGKKFPGEEERLRGSWW
jgi:hypothetical protein